VDASATAELSAAFFGGESSRPSEMLPFVLFLFVTWSRNRACWVEARRDWGVGVDAFICFCFVYKAAVKNEGQVPYLLKRFK
jgi:hypothetical protein